MPQAYHFLKYDRDTTPAHLIKRSEENSVLCFDLEDSVYDWIDHYNNISLKAQKRIILSNILCESEELLLNTKLGVRVNSAFSGEFEKDFSALSKIKNINSIFIPKVNSVNDLEVVIKNISAEDLEFKELIPVIETKKGMNNLKEMLSTFPIIKKVCFGHCDYNLDIRAFPFFHQDSLEYWKWVNKIIEITGPHNVKFINSPFLELENIEFFRSILSHLSLITKGEFGQITLNSLQTKCCVNFREIPSHINTVAKERHSLRTERNELESIIDKFENENSGKAFTITRSKTIISPQEYCCAKYLSKKLFKNIINMAFTGGCFPVQHNILHEDTFHRILKTKLEANFDVNFNLNIIRYERFINCLSKIKNLHNAQTIDYLVFHIRAEPFLRLIKLFYRYQDYQYKTNWSLNLPFRQKSEPEKYDMMLLARRYIYSEEKKRSILYKGLIDMNYLLGCVAGNNGHALKKYLQLVQDVIKFCNRNSIKLYILGPAIRSNTFMEYLITLNMEKYFSGALFGIKGHYIYGLDKHKNRNTQYFESNGTHATESYHKLIALKLYDKIKIDLEKGNN